VFKKAAIFLATSTLGVISSRSYLPTTEIEVFLGSIYEYFKTAFYHSKPARDYLESRGLKSNKLVIGYNSGQFHHGERKNKELLTQALAYGLLLDKGYVNNRTLEKAYAVFGNKSLVFALKNKADEIVSFYFRKLDDNKGSETSHHFYLKNRAGLYPGYPSKKNRILILTESIIDAASLVQHQVILGKACGTSHVEVLACYGTNGLTKEHQEVINSLRDLEEIIYAFDQDTAGQKAVEKLSKLLHEDYPGLKQSSLTLPNKDVNETLQAHADEGIFLELLNQRKELLFSSEEKENSEVVFLSSIEKENPKTQKEENKIQESLSLKEINELIGESGIIGEEQTRLLLFIIASSYKTEKPLHAIVQGSSGSGKTHLISKIVDLMPQEDVLRFTRITESSLYNWGEYDLVGKCMLIEDLDGLKEEALYSLREIISNQQLSSSVSIKDKKGQIKSIQKKVRGVFSSLSATTKGDLYEDNMSRSFVLAVDETESQSRRIIRYQNQKYAGEISKVS